MKKFIVLLLVLVAACKGESPFGYDLNFTKIPGTNGRTMLLCHGFGGNYQIAERLKTIGCIDATLISFNFPDHDAKEGVLPKHKVTFGTIDEILPALYVLKQCVIDEKRNQIDLYGYSAGGGAVVNLIATLNTTNYDAELEQIGIGAEEKRMLLNAIQNGIVILDTPLKSIEEIGDIRGETPEMQFIAKNYRDSHMRPIDSLALLDGLSLDVILHFQEPDEIIFNRDDPYYVKRLREVNAQGTTSIVLGNDGGHKAPHLSLWQFYSQKITK